MQFNMYIWELYKKSEEYKNIIEEFEGLTPEIMRENGDYHYWKEDSADGTTMVEHDLYRDVQKAIKTYNIQDRNDAYLMYEDLVKNGIPRYDYATWEKYAEIKTDKSRNSFFAWTYELSMVMFSIFPDYFIPFIPDNYNKGRDYNYLLFTFEEFNIPLPTIPNEGEREKRALYYLEIIKALYTFGEEFEMDTFDICAFLYNFSPNFFIDYFSDDYPDPYHIWILKASEEDIKHIDRLEETDETPWGGSSNARKGDLALIYEPFPNQCIKTIWRVLADSYRNPFSYHYFGMMLANKIDIEPVILEELKDDPILSKNPIIKSNLFHARDFKFNFEEYQAFRNILESKGQDMEQVINFGEPLHLPNVGSILNERMVEEHLIERFLLKIGYTKDDWVRQLPLKMGTSTSFYPDYAFHVSKIEGDEESPMILEAKYTLRTFNLLKKALKQAKSYAFRLRSEKIILASLEGIWIYNYPFDINNPIHKAWGQLEHEKDIIEIRNLIFIPKKNKK